MVYHYSRFYILLGFLKCLNLFSYQTFLGNDQYGSSEYGSRVHVNVLEPPIHRLVALRILPKTWHNRICLRLEVLGCNAVQVNSVENNPGNLFWPIIMTKNQHIYDIPIERATFLLHF